MLNQLLFRQARLTDFAGLVPLVNEFDQSLSAAKKQPEVLKKEQARSRRYVKKYLADPACVYLLCTQADHLVGYSFLSIDKRHRRVAYLHELFVLANQRGNRIGQRLVEESLSWLQQNECQQIKLRVNRHNVAATGLYKKLGFILEPNDYVDMSLNL